MYVIGLQLHGYGFIQVMAGGRDWKWILDESEQTGCGYNRGMTLLFHQTCKLAGYQDSVSLHDISFDAVSKHATDHVTPCRLLPPAGNRG